MIIIAIYPSGGLPAFEDAVHFLPGEWLWDGILEQKQESGIGAEVAGYYHYYNRGSRCWLWRRRRVSVARQFN